MPRATMLQSIKAHDIQSACEQGSALLLYRQILTFDSKTL